MNQNYIIDGLGFTGSILIGLSFIPQTYKTIYDQTSDDVSYFFLFLSLLSSSLMVLYGSYYIIYPMIISNGSVFVNCTIIIIYKTYFSRPATTITV